jgi:hypothetical protein
MASGADLKLRLTINDQVTRRLKALSQKLQNRLTKEGMNEAGKLLSRMAADFAPTSKDQRLVPGLLKRAISFKTKTYRRRSSSQYAYVVVLIVGPRKGFRTPKSFKKARAALREAGGRRQEIRELWMSMRKKTRYAKVIGKTQSGGEIYQVPSYYAHLAGPRRRATFIRQAAQAGRRLVSSLLEGKLRQALSEAGG